MADSMALSPGSLFLHRVANAASIAKSAINNRLLVNGAYPVSYVFTTRSDEQEGTGGDVPIFLDESQPPPIHVKDCAVLSFDTVTSTHSILEALVRHPAFDATEILVTSKRQVSGRGRRGERVWSSPDGCAMFSFTHRFDMNSMIGQHIGFLQHLVSLAIVRSAPAIPDLRIKWPNDVYYKNSKIAGLIVNCHLGAKNGVALIGVGIDVDNGSPSDCINRILREDLQIGKLVQQHDLISDVVSNFRQALAGLNTPHDFQQIKQSYTKHWMHTGQEFVYKEQKLFIQDVDDEGFVRAKPKDGGPEVTIGFDFEDVSLPVT